MRIMLMIAASWAGLTVLAAGVFVAVIRGGGGTDLAPLAGDEPVAADVRMPAQRAGDETAAALPEVAMPEQRAGAVRDARTHPRT